MQLFGRVVEHPIGYQLVERMARFLLKRTQTTCPLLVLPSLAFLPNSPTKGLVLRKWWSSQVFHNAIELPSHAVHTLVVCIQIFSSVDVEQMSCFQDFLNNYR